MRRALATIQLLGFLVVGLAMVEPGPSRLLRHWSGSTIYPRWALLYVGIGVLASVVSLLLPDESWAPVVPTVLAVLAAQLTGLGLVGVKHWEPAFGQGGGYAGQVHHLVLLAWGIAAAGVIAAAAAVAQLVHLGVFPVRASVRAALLFGAVGAFILVALPYGISDGHDDLQDLTSLVAFALVYSAPIGATVAVSAWLPGRLRAVAIASCAVAAAVSAVDRSLDVTQLQGRPAFSATSVILGVVAVAVMLYSGSHHPAQRSQA